MGALLPRDCLINSASNLRAAYILEKITIKIEFTHSRDIVICCKIYEGFKKN